ncbi:MAG: glycosyltransferase family 2 protein [Hyphomonadaceae bacterium]|nr:glycosyltransferase family 2 protein [Hyphomonadaceae bacterium]
MQYGVHSMSTGSPHLRLVTNNDVSSMAKLRADARDILVAIPVLNELNHIEACVESLMQGDERLSEVRFVVADGGSTDGTRDILDILSARYPNFSWIDNPGRLQSAGVNAVAAMARHESVLVRCDAHSIYPPGYVTQVADALVRRQVASLVVPMDAVGDGCFQKANAWVVDTPLGSGGSAHRGGQESKYVDHGHHAGFDLSVFRAVSGYDPGFSHNEDAEYDTRVGRFGGRIYLDADIRLAYKPRATPWALARQYFNYGKGRARTIRKHNIRPRPRQMFPVLNLFAQLGSFALAPVLPVWWVCPVFYGAILLGASAYLTMKHRSLCGLMAGPAAAIMHVSWALGLCRQVLRPKR